MKSFVVPALFLATMLSCVVLGDDMPVCTASSASADKTIDLSNVPTVRGRDEQMRSIVKSLIDNDFCGDAIADGVTASAAARGEAPIAGIGFAKLAEEDFTAVAIELAEEELAGLLAKQQTHEPVNVMRLSKIICLLDDTTVLRDEVLGVLRRIAEQSSPEWDSMLAYWTGGAWIQLTIETQGAEKCLEIGRLFQTTRGVDSPEFCKFIWALETRHAFAKCRTDEDVSVLLRFLVDASETCQSYGTAYMIDQTAMGDVLYVPAVSDTTGRSKAKVWGWQGSVQRRRLAERFNRGKLSANAAVELAADEKDLTDLREVYGAWEGGN